MIYGGILEKTSSPYNSPVMGVLKKDKSVRLVNNYATKNGLNSRLLESRFPVVSMRLLFGQISQYIAKLKAEKPIEKIIFSSIDIRNGFYSLSISQNSRDLTSFIIGSRQVRYKRLAQGMSISPSEFSRYVSETFLSNYDKNQSFKIFVFIDDIAIISSESDHIDALENIF